MFSATPYLKLACITKTRGLEGEVMAHVATGLPFCLYEGLKVWIVPPTEAGAVQFEIESVLPAVKNSENTFSKMVDLNPYSRGMGAIGLPGDLSSQSRFIRAAFVKCNSVSLNGNESCVNQFFHIINSVEQVRGCCELDDNKYEITIYSSCCNASRGIYYYTTYNNHQINAIDMNKVDLNSDKLVRYPLIDKENINYVN